MFGWAARWNRNRQPDRLKRLAERVDALALKDSGALDESRRIERLRVEAAVGLHALCAQFVRDLNGLIATTELSVDPAVYEPEHFKDGSANLFQINARGRILQFEFEVAEKLLSTENFPEPYTLEGAIRGFNQELLEHDAIEEEQLFFCINGTESGWRVFDPRTYQTSDLDEDYLITLLGRLV
ncbi:MAG: hypothetical protein M3Y07_03690 [Acidobacteriota bacterium]|nr:hypothetical protein [Acidobacteriota bacterium]